MTLLAWLRSSVTMAAAGLFTFAIVGLWSLRYPFLRRRWQSRLRWRDFILRNWGKVLLKLLRVDVEVRGRPPAEGGVVVCNHLSYIDILILGAGVGGSFVAKSEIEGWPIFGRLCHVGEVIFVRRSVKRDIPRVIREIDRRLEAGSPVLIFPEGTSTGGDDVAPFRPSLLAPAAEGRIPVHYAALKYQTFAGDLPARDVVCWWGGMPFGDHIQRLMGLRGFRARIAFGDEPVVDEDRKRLASRLEGEVRKLFHQLNYEE